MDAMAYDDALAVRVRALIGDDPDITERRMFGGLAFLAGGHMAVAASGEGGLMVRVDPGETDALVADAGVERMEMRGRRLDGWLRVDEGVLGGEAELRPWVERGLRFARALPPKG
jgi:TfoX/Sxy family transcriptional regulator of competence genes